MENSAQSSGNAILRLVRIPNLLSVPGDPLAGACLAAAAASGHLSTGAFQLGGLPAISVIAAALASVAAYAGGMVDNDLVDLERDRGERPERPLPSGQVGLRAAGRLRVLLLLLPYALGLAVTLPPLWFAAQLALLVAILAYNRVKEQVPLAGFLLMGLCRGLSLLTGAALFGVEALEEPTVLAAFIVWTAYVAGLTAFASTETVCGVGPLRYLLLTPFGLLLALALFGMTQASGMPFLLTGILGGMLAGTALLACGDGAEPRLVQRTVGRLIRVLVPMQACTCLAVREGVWAALFLTLCWLVSYRLSQRYAAS